VVPHLRRSGFFLLRYPALTGWAKFYRAYGACLLQKPEFSQTVEMRGMDCAQLGTQIAGRALHGVGGVLFFVAVPPSMRQAAGL
jgi:hypothetical protein